MGALVVSLAAVTVLALVTAALALFRLRAVELRARVRTARADAILDAARAFAAASAESLDAVDTVLVRAARELCPEIDAFAIFALAEGRLRCRFASGDRLRHYAGSELALDVRDNVVSRALAARRRLVAVADERLHPALPAAVVFPIGGPDASDVLYAGARAPIPAASADLIATLVDHAGPAAMIARGRDDDRRRATHDGLTGLLTPRAFRTRLGEACARAQSDPFARLAVAFIDTDNFKMWNDRFGHGAGDALLQRLAALFADARVLPYDLAARNGGDEFCLVWFDCERSEALARAELVRARVESEPFGLLLDAGAEASVAISVSVGVAALPYDGTTAEELLETADAAMYAAKRAGRNRVA